MNGQVRQMMAILLVLVICPVLTVFHGTALADETGDSAQQSQVWEYRQDGKHTPGANRLETPLESLDVLIDNFSGLSDADKAKVKENLRVEIDKAVADAGFDNSAEDVIIPIAGILFAAFAVSTPVLIVALVLIFSYRKRQQRIEIIKKFVDSGQEVPKELLEEHNEADAVGKDSNMKRGILLMGVGLGLLIAIGFLAGWKIGAIGLIPFFIGLARFIIWKLESKETGIDPVEER